jgi:hypothetical protein
VVDALCTCFASGKLSMISGFVMWGSIELSHETPKTRTLKRFEKAVRAAHRLTARSRDHDD